MPISFIKGAIKNPKRTGAIAPSSSDLGREMMRHWPTGEDACIVEFGPGTGSFTRWMAEKQMDEKVLALELNPEFARLIQEKYPRIEVHNACAEKLRDIVDKQLKRKVDFVLSGLPWAAMPSEVQVSIMDNTIASMSDGAVFSTFAYVHALKMQSAKRFADMIEHKFSRVEKSKIIWRNIPPAIVYHCFK